MTQRRFVGVIASAFVVGFCGALTAKAAVVPHRQPAQRYGGWMARNANPRHAWMYVASGTSSVIAIYDLASPFGPRLIGKITQGLTNPSGLAVDARGTLYAANYDNGNPEGTVVVYPPRATRPSLTLSQDLSVPLSVNVDAGGNVWVLNRGSAPSIVVYPPGQSSPSHVITTALIQYPGQIVFDSAQNAYFSDYATGVSEIANGSYQPVSINLQGLSDASGVAINSRSGDLFVSTDGPQKVLVYALGDAQPERTLKLRVTACFLSSGILKGREYIFVPDCGSTGDVWIFKSGASKPLATWNFPATGGACCIAFKPAGVP